ncbi:hypothetical protein [Aquabacterium sp.]|uniref:hypothetical protein n=1 Tax=Aquabacterium sp. TaxID=1872578 RepID=UPI0035B09846
MANPALKPFASHGNLFGQPTERQALQREKLGVMSGFVVGMLVAAGTVSPHLVAAGVPDIGAHAASAVVVAACTWVGYRLGTAGRRGA